MLKNCQIPNHIDDASRDLAKNNNCLSNNDRDRDKKQKDV